MTPAVHPLLRHQAIVLLTEGHSDPFVAKTAMSVLRYRHDAIAAILDSQAQASTAEQLFGFGGPVPVVQRLADVARCDAVYVGIAPPGGELPEAWRPILLEALERGIDVVSGLHDFLSQDAGYVTAARRSGARLIDVRDQAHLRIARAAHLDPGVLRVLTVGQDCSVGKMVTTLEVQQALQAQGEDAAFVATGQTGIMISGQGLPIDRMIVDFVNGAAEQLVLDQQQHAILMFEGQGSISHPAYSAVTLGLLHGTAPHGLIYCYEAGRQEVKGLDGIPLVGIARQMEAYRVAAELRHPTEFIGVAVNTRRLDAAAAEAEILRVSREFDLPACDVYRQSAQPLVEAVLALRRRLGLTGPTPRDKERA